MRLWSVHPRYLDSIGLVSLWREALLAKKVLQGKTKGYIHHPQLIRFQKQSSPVASINSYLRPAWIEAEARGYSFNKKLIGKNQKVSLIPISTGQLEFEFEHLLQKIKARNKNHYEKIIQTKNPIQHPLFTVLNGSG